EPLDPPPPLPVVGGAATAGSVGLAVGCAVATASASSGRASGPVGRRKTCGVRWTATVVRCRCALCTCRAVGCFVEVLCDADEDGALDVDGVLLAWWVVEECDGLAAGDGFTVGFGFGLGFGLGLGLGLGLVPPPAERSGSRKTSDTQTTPFFTT